MSAFNLNSEGSASSAGSEFEESLSIVDFQNLIRYALIDMEKMFIVNIEPQALPLLIQIAETESQVPVLFEKLVSHIPYLHSSAFSLLNVIINCLPLPELNVREKLYDQLCSMLEASEVNETVQLNTCYVWAVMARKLAGKFAIDMFTPRIQSILSRLIKFNENNHVKLAAILAIESFAQTQENKLEISKNKSILNEFEALCVPRDDVPPDQLACYHQIQFLTEWSLDNRYGYEVMTPISSQTLKTLFNDSRVVLNRFDCTPGVKVSRNGQTIRNDTGFFESIRATSPCIEGATYYEIKIHSSGICQVGWATKLVTFSPEEGVGVGDDDQSFAFDGSRRRLWHQGEPTPYYAQNLQWKENDIIGCFLDMEHGIILFFLNGVTIEPVFYMDEEKTKDFQEKGGLYPALSLLTHQQVSVNFGKEPFQHANLVNQFVQRIWKERDEELNGDEILWTSLNSRPGAAIPQQILDFVPKMIRDKDVIQPNDPGSNVSNSVDDSNLCQVCFDRNQEVGFHPCGHTQFCRKCAERMEFCPLCRHKIDGFDALPLTKREL